MILRFPVYYPLCVISTGTLEIVTPTVVMVAVAVFLAAGVHSVMDILESDLELKSWPRTAHQAVYNHITDSGFAHSGKFATPARRRISCSM